MSKDEYMKMLARFTSFFSEMEWNPFKVKFDLVEKHIRTAKLSESFEKSTQSLGEIEAICTIRALGFMSKLFRNKAILDMFIDVYALLYHRVISPEKIKDQIKERVTWDFIEGTTHYHCFLNLYDGVQEDLDRFHSTLHALVLLGAWTHEFAHHNDLICGSWKIFSKIAGSMHGISGLDKYKRGKESFRDFCLGVSEASTRKQDVSDFDFIYWFMTLVEHYYAVAFPGSKIESTIAICSGDHDPDIVHALYQDAGHLQILVVESDQRIVVSPYGWK